MILNYAGFSALENTDWEGSSGLFYGNTITLQYPESISFGAQTIYVGYKIIACEYRVKESILIGHLYIPESLIVKFVFGEAEKKTGQWFLSGTDLRIFQTDANIRIDYVQTP